MRRLLTLPIQFLIFSALLVFQVDAWAANDWKDASASTSHTIALKTDGRVFATGANADGQLGNGTTTASGTFIHTIVAKSPVGSGPDPNQDEGWGKMPGTLSTLSATQGTVYNKVALSWTADPDATTQLYRVAFGDLRRYCHPDRDGDGPDSDL